MTVVVLAIIVIVHFLLLFSVWRGVRALVDIIKTACEDLETKLEVLSEPVNANERKLWKQVLELKREREKWDKLIDQSFKSEYQFYMKGMNVFQSEKSYERQKVFFRKQGEDDRARYRGKLIETQRKLERKQLKMLLGEWVVDKALHWPIRIQFSDHIEPSITTKGYEDYQDDQMCAPVWYYHLPESIEGNNEYLDNRENEINSWKRALKETLVAYTQFDVLTKLEALREVYNFARQDKTAKISQPMWEEIEIRIEILEEEKARRN